MNPLFVVGLLIFSNLVSAAVLFSIGMSGDGGSWKDPVSLVGILILLLTPLEALFVFWVIKKQKR